ncbi:hypothetical protein RRG08_007779 [Elysia crispata]|uniref:Uncharacterized protein n=1 Tax=Elysia crispata TaxID=231223 RepID=A0AAE1E9Y1_9GAST|nr:hypothetical protein RRG08_007779 [Elysia crispata]
MTEAARKSSAEGLKRLRHMPIGLGINREQSFLTRKAQHSKRDTHRVGRKRNKRWEGTGRESSPPCVEMLRKGRKGGVNKEHGKRQGPETTRAEERTGVCEGRGTYGWSKNSFVNKQEYWIPRQRACSQDPQNSFLVETGRDWPPSWSQSKHTLGAPSNPISARAGPDANLDNAEAEVDGHISQCAAKCPWGTVHSKMVLTRAILEKFSSVPFFLTNMSYP